MKLLAVPDPSIHDRQAYLDTAKAHCLTLDQIISFVGRRGQYFADVLEEALRLGIVVESKTTVVANMLALEPGLREEIILLGTGLSPQQVAAMPEIALTRKCCEIIVECRAGYHEGRVDAVIINALGPFRATVGGVGR